VIDDLHAQAVQAQSTVEQEMLAKRNVVGVGVGYKESHGETTDEVAVVVLVEQKKPLAALQPEDLIPREVDGLRTDVMEVGRLWANANSPRDRFRPVIPSGVSIGHYKITAGTLGTMVKDRRTGDLFILSNNHVLANCNDAVLGDPVTQPGPMDGGQNPADVVAKLERYVKLGYIGDLGFQPAVVGLPPPATPPVTPPPVTNPPPRPQGQTCDILNVIVSLLNGVAKLIGSQHRVTPTTAAALAAQHATGPVFMGLTAQDAQSVPQNTCDCALARPIDPALFSDDIQQIGLVNATKAPQLGMRVRKFGRTTGYSEGIVKLLNATVNVGYATTAGNRQAQFVGQVITEPLSQGGDSGSLIVDTVEPAAVGLLFAGSNVATIFTPIDVVLNTLEVNI